MKQSYLKECSHHGLTDHAVRKSGGYRCRRCAVEAVTKRRRIVKYKLIDAHGGKCKRCGYKRSKSALQFHHKDPSQKEFTISKKIKSFEVLLQESMKCELVCSNCHAEIHDDLRLKLSNTFKET